MRYLVIFFLPVIGAVFKWTLFAGSGPIWPWLVASCIVASLWDRRAAAIIGVGVVVAQVLERWQSDPEIAQGVVFTIGAIVLARSSRLIAAGFIALASVAYLFAGLAVLPWFPAVVLTEFFIVFALMGIAYEERDPISLGSPSPRAWDNGNFGNFFGLSGYLRQLRLHTLAPSEEKPPDENAP